MTERPEHTHDGSLVRCHSGCPAWPGLAAIAEALEHPEHHLSQPVPLDTELTRQHAETAIRAAGGEGDIQMWNLAVRIPAHKVAEVHAVIAAMDGTDLYRSWMISYPPPMLVTLPEELLADLRDVLGKQVDGQELDEAQAVEAAVRDWIHAARFSGRPYWCEQHGWQSNYMPCPRRRHR